MGVCVGGGWGLVWGEFYFNFIFIVWGEGGGGDGFGGWTVGGVVGEDRKGGGVGFIFVL